MTGHLFPCLFSAFSSVEAKLKLPSMNSPSSFGRLTPDRLNTKSALAQKSSSSTGSLPMSYSKISPMAISRVRFLPSLGLRRLATSFFPTKPFAPVMRIFVLIPRCSAQIIAPRRGAQTDRTCPYSKISARRMLVIPSP